MRLGDEHIKFAFGYVITAPTKTNSIEAIQSHGGYLIEYPDRQSERLSGSVARVFGKWDASRIAEKLSAVFNAVTPATLFGLA